MKQQVHFNKNAIKALAIDLDGTSLRSDSVMSPRTQDALKACLSRGIKVLISTGRSPVAAKPFSDALALDGPMVFYNGAAVIDLPSGKIVKSSLLSGECSRFCVELAEKHDVHFHAFLTDHNLVYAKQRAESDAYEKRTGLQGIKTDMRALFGKDGKAAAGCIKGMFVGEDAALTLVQKELKQHCTVEVYCARSHVTYLEVMSSSVSKGIALKQALELRGLSAAETIAFGDSENDLPMAEVAACFYAPENALPVVKEKALSVFPTNDEDGLAWFLEHFIL